MEDFNVDIDSSSSDARQLTILLESFDLDWYFSFLTHIHGHSLDLMIFAKGYDVISVSSSGKISDRFSVVLYLNIPINYSRTALKTIKYCEVKAVSKLVSKSWFGYKKKSQTQYSRTCAAIWVSSAVRLIFKPHWSPNRSPSKPPNWWITTDILASDRHGRYLEHVCRKTLSALSRSRLPRQNSPYAKDDVKSKIFSLFQKCCYTLKRSSVIMEGT